MMATRPTSGALSSARDGTQALVAGIAMSFYSDTFQGMVTLIAVFILLPILGPVLLHAMPRTAMGKKLFAETNALLEPTLGVRLEIAAMEPWPANVDDLGAAMTALRAEDGGADVDWVVGLIGGLLLDAPGDAEWNFSWRYLALPAAALVLWFVYRQRLGVTRRRWLTASAVFVVAMVALPGWVLLVNSVATDGEPVAIEGQVLEKRSTSGKASSHSVRIHDDRTGATVKIHVTAPEYRALNVGDHFRRMFRTGRLGISYRWRLG